jgi:hypothetical protein
MPNTTWRRDVGSDRSCDSRAGVVEDEEDRDEGEFTSASSASAAAAEEGCAWAWVRSGVGSGAGRWRSWNTMRRERRGSPMSSARSGTTCDGVAMVGGGVVWVGSGKRRSGGRKKRTVRNGRESVGE